MTSNLYVVIITSWKSSWCPYYVGENLSLHNREKLNISPTSLKKKTYSCAQVIFQPVPWTGGLYLLLSRSGRTWIPSALLRFGQKYYPTDAHVWILGSQFVSLSWDAVESLRWETWWTEIGQLEMGRCEFQLSLTSAPCSTASCQSLWCNQLPRVPIAIPCLAMMTGIPPNLKQKQNLLSCSCLCHYTVTELRNVTNPVFILPAQLHNDITLSFVLSVHRNRGPQNCYAQFYVTSTIR